MERMAESARQAGSLLTDNVQGELSPHVIVVPGLNGKKIACAIERSGHDAQSGRIIDMPDAAPMGSYRSTVLGTRVRAEHRLRSSENKRAVSPHALRSSAVIALGADWFGNDASTHQSLTKSIFLCQ